MGITSAIEWTDATWNPWQGCTKVSPACKNCYMFRDMKRYGKDGSIVRRSSQHTFDLPLKLSREGGHKIPSGSKVFTCSWSDWFHEEADEWRADAWAIVRQRPDLIFQIVTKRTERIADCLPPDWGDGWPNVWLIATVENQHWADIRIPQLLGVPAQVRGLSCEPLLGPIDLRGWGDQTPSNDYSQLPDTWSAFRWPEWVPADQRKQIESFWSPGCGRSPRSWAEDNFSQHTPAMGSVITCGIERDGFAYVSKMPPEKGSRIVTGRYLHCWNNIGRIILDDGSVVPAAGGSGSGWLTRYRCPDGEYRHRLHWIIAGGESGSESRTTHPDWIRSLRDQCKSRRPVAPFDDNVPFFFKQWGDWVPSNQAPQNIGRLTRAKRAVLLPDHQHMFRIGTKSAGRMIDGREWSEFPKVSNRKVSHV